MLTYQGKEIVRFKEKTGGKNKSDVDGFYKDSDGRKFFIKNRATLVSYSRNYLQACY